jgi:hypothetical protein
VFFSSPQLVDREDSTQKKSVLLIATCCSHFQDLDLGKIPDDVKKLLRSMKIMVFLRFFIADMY